MLDLISQESAFRFCSFTIVYVVLGIQSVHSFVQINLLNLFRSLLSDNISS